MQTWKILSLSVSNAPNPDTVVSSSFQVSDNGQFVNYSIDLLPTDIKNFTQYTNITEKQAIEWTQDALGVDRISEINKTLNNLIKTAEIPLPKIMPLPWAE
jgi:hypothetical protein